MAGERSEEEVQGPSDDDVVEKVDVESDEDDSEADAYRRSMSHQLHMSGPSFPLAATFSSIPVDLHNIQLKVGTETELMLALVITID